MSDGPTVWAEAMLAAALLAVDPGLGGVIVRAGPGPVRDAWLAGFRALLPSDAPWRRLPPQIDDGRLLGGIDLAAALGAGRRVLQRGLLAEADGGVVLVPMSERLDEATAARLAAALDDHAVAVQRDGFSETLDTRFVLLALDEGIGTDESTPTILGERLAFHINLDVIGVHDAQPISAGPDDIAEAQAVLRDLDPPDAAAVEAICQAAVALGVSSLRAPSQALRVAAALAALEGRTTVETADLSTATRLVMAPRATRMPVVEEDTQDDAAVDASSPEPETQDVPEEEHDPGQPDDAAEPTALDPSSLAEMILDAARSALPEGLEALWQSDGASQRSVGNRPGGAGAKQRAAKRGRRIGARPGALRDASALDVVETLKAAAPWQRLRAGPTKTDARARLQIRRDDFRIRRFEQRAESTVIFVVDASGSAALQRLAEAKGAVELLLAEAYVRRTQVALIAFRGVTADLLLPPTRSLTRARRALGDLAGGGATPLAAALEAGAALAVAERSKGRTPMLVILTDGRGNIALDGAAFRTRAETDALNAARRIRATGTSVAFIDTSARPRGEGARLAEAMAARFSTLPYVEAGALRDVVRSLDRPTAMV